MTGSPDRATTSERRSSAAVHAMVLFPLLMCVALYAYYFVAQAVINPLPVEGVLKSAVCRPGGLSRQGTPTGIPSVRVVYEFPSRSRSPSNATVRHPTGLDEISDYIDYDTAGECDAAARAFVTGSTRTIWAGENDMGDRFRARFTAERQYPSSALLWGPACLAVLVLGVRSRLVSRHRR